MNDDELYQMIIKNWGTLHECPACGETALSTNLDGDENCLMCGYEYEMEDDDREDWYCDECDTQFANEDEFRAHIGTLQSAGRLDPQDEYCITQEDDSKYDDWKDRR